MTIAPDPLWDSLLDASDAEEAWQELQDRQDRRIEYAPTSAAGATSIATTAPQGPTVDQVDGLPALPPALREGGSSALARPLVVSQTDDDPAGRTPLSRPVGESERSAGRKLPQSEWPAFRVPTCKCGHASGDHRNVSNGVAHIIGVCFRCDCPAFDETPDDRKAA